MNIQCFLQPLSQTFQHATLSMCIWECGLGMGLWFIQPQFLYSFCCSELPVKNTANSHSVSDILVCVCSLWPWSGLVSCRPLPSLTLTEMRERGERERGWRKTTIVHLLWVLGYMWCMLTAHDQHVIHHIKQAIPVHLALAPLTTWCHICGKLVVVGTSLLLLLLSRGVHICVLNFLSAQDGFNHIDVRFCLVLQITVGKRE